MRATLPVLLCLLLIVPVATAQVGSPPPGTVWTVMNTVEATVQGNYAIVRVIADIANRGPDPEFPFLVTIPDDAFVTGLTIERDGEVYEARIEDRAKARAEYDAHKAQEQTGGLVEKQRRSQTYAYLINVAEFTNVRATLTYERYLAADRGVYNLSLESPVSGFGQDLGAKFRVLVKGADVASAWGMQGGHVQRLTDAFEVTYAVGPRPDDASTPFQASYTLAPTAGAGDLRTTTHNGTGYFVHTFRAPADAERMPVDLVLVLDISGSMGGLKMQQMQDAAAQVIQQLGPEDRLHLAFFSSDASSPWEGLRAMTPEARRAAAEEVRNAFVAGGTNLESAIRSGFDAFDGVDWTEEEGRLPALVILTDGQPTVGMTDRPQLRQMARDANDHGINVFAIAFGSDADWSFIHGIAADGEGVALHVPEGAGAEVDIRRFMQALTTPVLKDVRIAYPSHAKATRATAPILFAGSEIVVVGTYDAGQGPLTARVTARAPDGERAYNVTSASGSSLSFLPRVVAYHEIRRLADLIAAEGERPEWAAEIAKLGLRHGFVTDYTSLVVTLEPRASCEGCEVRMANATGEAWTVDQDATLGTWDASATSGGNAFRTDQGGAAAPNSATSPTSQAFTTPSPPVGESAPRVPGPGLLLVLAILALGAVATRARRAGK